MAKIKIYTEEQLNDMTVAALRELCKTYGITGMSKQRKEDIVSAILNFYEPEEEVVEEDDNEQEDNYKASSDNGKLPYLNSKIHSFATKDKYESVISVSCGAASSNFAVVGKTVGYVKSTYREILNIDVDSSSVVNGENVKESYVLKSGDTLEFLRKAGSKG